MRMLVRMLLIGFAFCAALVPDRASALSCAAPRSIEESYANYDAVVVANVDEVNEKRSGKELKLTVLTSFKGLEERKITVAEDLTWGTSKRGTQYLFFLNEKDGAWEHPLCSPTKTTGAAAQELAFLKDKEIPIPEMKVPAAAEGAPRPWVVPVVSVCVLSVLVFAGVRFAKRGKGKNK